MKQMFNKLKIIFILSLILQLTNINAQKSSEEQIKLLKTPPGKCRVYFVMPLKKGDYRTIYYDVLAEEKNSQRSLGGISAGSQGAYIFDPGKYAFYSPHDYYKDKRSKFEFKADKTYFIKVTADKENQSSQHTYNSFGDKVTETSMKELGMRTDFKMVSESEGKKLMLQFNNKANITHIYDIENNQDQTQGTILFNRKIEDIALHPDGKTFGVCGGKEAKFYTVPNGKCYDSLQYSSPIKSITFSNDGKLIAIITDSILEIRDASDRGIKHTINENHGIINAMKFSPDNNTLATCGKDRTIKIWDLSNGNLLQTFSGHSEPVKSICYSPDGKLIASVGTDTTIMIWDRQSDKPVAFFKTHKKPIKKILFSPNGKLLVSIGTDPKICVFNMDNMQIQSTISYKDEYFTDIIFSSDSRKIYTSSTYNEVKIWDLLNGNMLSSLEGKSGMLSCISFSTSRKYFAAGGLQNIIIWQTGNNKQIKILKGKPAFNEKIFFTIDGKYIISKGSNREVKIWDFEDL